MRKIHLVGMMVLASATAAWADDFPSLPAGPGRDVTVRVCSQCHSPEIASNQRMDKDGWKSLVDQMANNGANATSEEFDTITNYLATVFPANGGAAPAAPDAATPPPAGGSATTNDATGTVTPQQ
ncbi:MAG: hypothetical protein J0G99_07745 [Alphaproteobacteria bacterium]|nr:hypothetical protein [Alphaproteobacteria bacterium]